MHWTYQISKAPSKCHKKKIPNYCQLLNLTRKFTLFTIAWQTKPQNPHFSMIFLFRMIPMPNKSLHPIFRQELCLSTCPFKIIILIEISKRNIVPIQRHKHISFNWSWFVYIIISQSWLRDVNAEITNLKIYHNCIFKGYYCSLNR